MAVLIAISAAPAKAGEKEKYIPPPPPCLPIICKPTPVPLPSSLPAGLLLLGAVGVIAYRQRAQAQA